MKPLKCTVIIFLAVVTCVMRTEVAWANSAYDKGGEDSYKAPFVPKTEYEKKLAEFSKPKPGVLGADESEYGTNIMR